MDNHEAFEPAMVGDNPFVELVLGLVSWLDRLADLTLRDPELPLSGKPDELRGALVDAVLGVISFRTTLELILSEALDATPVSDPPIQAEPAWGRSCLR